MNLAWRLFGLALFLYPGCCLRPPEPLEPLAQTAFTKRVFVVSHGWHTGLVLPAGFLEDRIPDLKNRFQNSAFYEIGWGDRDF